MVSEIRERPRKSSISNCLILIRRAWAIMPSDTETLSVVRPEKSQCWGNCEKFITTTIKDVWEECHEAPTVGWVKV